jgi:cell wall-associated NlpC family hydrolase
VHASTPFRLVSLFAIAATIALGGCAAHPAPRVLPPSASAPSAVVRTAQSYLGAPYRNGGADPAGFDCSGFVRYVYARHGITVPRDVKRQWQVGQDVPRTRIRPGDLLFFSTTGPGPTHVSLAIDGQRFVHAPSSRGVVRIEALTSTYWGRRFVGARRVLP